MDQIVDTAPGVGTVRGRTSVSSQIATIAAVVIPPLGLLSAMGLLWGVAFHWIDLVLLVVLYVLTAIGNAVGFHRYFTHKSFETGPVIKGTLAILGSMAMQGPITQWVTDHRKHHAFSDKDGDPHSPHVGHGDGVGGTIRGFLHAHVGWLFTLEGHGAGPRVRQGSLRGPARADDRPALRPLGRSSRSGSRSSPGTSWAARSRAAWRRWSGPASSGSSSTSTPPSA